MMKQERVVIAEGRMSSLAMLACVPVLLVAVMTVALLSGWSRPEDGMYYRAYGPIVLIFFYGGALYATYEFADTLFNRKRYISTDGEYVYILHHRSIRIAQISKVYLGGGLLSDNLVILQRGRSKTSVRTHFLRDDPQLVLERLADLAGMPQS